MKIKVFLFVTTPFICAANDVWMYEDQQECEGLGVRCPGLAPNTCCYSPEGRVFYTVRTTSDRVTDELAVYRRKEDDVCGTYITSYQMHRDMCVSVNRDLITRGDYGVGVIWVYREESSQENGKRAVACDGQIQGDVIYTKGRKTWVISRAKMNGMVEEGIELPGAHSEPLDFFKVHADAVLDDYEEYASQEVQVLDTCEGSEHDVVGYACRIETVEGSR